MYSDYNMNQLSLPMDLEMLIPINHLSRVVNEQVERIPNRVINEVFQEEGRPSYHPKMMLKIILFAYTRGMMSGRKIEIMLQENVPMMWLSGRQVPSYRTINRARVMPWFDALLKEMFISLHMHLLEQKIIKGDRIFIDGTKIEADANKYSFVWEKSTKNHSERLQKKIGLMYEELKSKVDHLIEKEEDAPFDENDLITMEDAVSEIMANNLKKLALLG